MGKALPYFRWYPADAETDEKYSCLSDPELGFFHRCLNKSWINEGLPSDLDKLAAMMHVSRKYVDRMWGAVGQCFQLTEDIPQRYVNRRQEEERSYARSKSQKATDSVRTRYERRTNDLPRAYESVFVSVADFNSKKEVLRENPKPTGASKPPPGPAMSERFEDFWERYPVKDGKPITFGVWVSLVNIENESLVFSCLDRYLASDRGGRSPKNPSNWLHDCSRDEWKSDWPASASSGSKSKSEKNSESWDRI